MQHTLIVEVVGRTWEGFTTAQRTERTLLEPFTDHEAEALKARLLASPTVRQLVYARPDSLSFGDLEVITDVRIGRRTFTSEVRTEPRYTVVETYATETFCAFNNEDLFLDLMGED